MSTLPNGHDKTDRERAVPHNTLRQMPRAELFALARRRGVENTMVLTRDELVEAIERRQADDVPRNGHPGPLEPAEHAGVRADEPETAPPSVPAVPASVRPAAGQSSIPLPAVAAALMATAVFLWRRRR